MRVVYGIVCVAVLHISSTAAQGQVPFRVVPGPVGVGGVNVGGFGPVGISAGFGGFSPYGFGGFGGFGGLNGGFGYGPFNYSQQLFQQQSSLTQQIYQQQQNSLLNQIDAAQSQLNRLDGIKQQMFQQYLGMNDSDKARVRAQLVNDYLRLDFYGRQAWKRDPVVQHIIGQDLPRLDSLPQAVR